MYKGSDGSIHFSDPLGHQDWAYYPTNQTWVGSNSVTHEFWQYYNNDVSSIYIDANGNNYTSYGFG
jgi:hypothetical protein